ncbi:hypothetical protein DFH07DRAFT_578235 [Mycena maculata]|uniref:GATA-type domain-containing protein n=1 Tax=Mycena maculata TaxID=230809 RepID=A0AAD7N623_9AGAR|nr:hypothetical protein DFH07DRAFT_578235 [Mycena maculata]
MKRPSTYWDTDQGPPGRSIAHDFPHSRYPIDIPSLLDDSPRSPTPSATECYGRQVGSSNAAIDFSSLIPMCEEPDIDPRRPLLDLPDTYENQWPTSNMAQYDTFQRSNSSLWHYSSERHRLPQQWKSAAGSGAPLSPHFDEWPPHSPYSSATSSSSKSPYFRSTPNESALPQSSRRNNSDGETPKKSCSHCHVTSTPLWRRDPSTQRPLCNACGLYLQQRNRLRPQELIDADIDDDDTPQIPDEEYTGPKCSHCLTRQTSVWRRSKTGAQVCNACGVYSRLRGKERPLSLRRNKIKPRTKHAK